jgi:hypothetical protein
MRPLTAVELLQVWETGLDQSLLEKSLRLLSVACSVPDLNEMARLSVGERDARLLQLREWLFGSRLLNLAHCPKCAQAVEWENNLKDLQLQSPLPQARLNVFNLEIDGFKLRFRLLTSLDLLQAATGSAYLANPKKLLSACILDVQQGQQGYKAEDLPDTVLEALNQRMEEEDPQADIQMRVICPDCAHHWAMPFDILSYLWAEIDNWARHTLQEVYVLARAFSWSEQDILNMGVHRRQLYLEMLRS